MSFDIIRTNCCGLDVHKTWVFACIGITDDKGRTEYKRGRFSTFKSGLRELADFLLEHQCYDVCMESSGKYWIPVFNVLEEVVNVVIAHPKYTKPRTGEKSDTRDAKWICNLYMCDMIEPSFIPPFPIRVLRDLLRYMRKLINMRSSEKNRVLNCLTVSNMKLDDVFTDVHGKSARSIILYILTHPGEEIDVRPFLHKRCKHSAEEVTEAIQGDINEWQREKLLLHYAHIDEIDAHIASLQAVIKKLAESYKDSLELIKTIPGLESDMTAITVLAEIGDDMSHFATAKKLTAWCGVCPRPDSSAKKVKRTHVSHAGAYLKPVLIQVANALVKSKAHPEFGERYRRLKARRGHGRAIMAIARMLVVALWHVLSKKVPYDASGYMKEMSREHKVVLTQAEGLALLRSYGYTIEEEKDSCTGKDPPVAVADTG